MKFPVLATILRLKNVQQLFLSLDYSTQGSLTEGEGSVQWTSL
jgi:hypothetical protein